MEIPTVKIVSDSTPDGFVIINREDFDRAQHALFKERSKEKPEEDSFFEGVDQPTPSRTRAK